MQRKISVSAALPALPFLLLAVALCLIVSWRYAIFRDGVDLGIFTQIIAGTAHGFSSRAEGGVNHLLVHWSPIVVLAWPFLRVFGPVGLEYFQAILVAAVLFPVWGIARVRFSRAVSLSIIAIASFYPTLWANGVGDFHEMAFVPLLAALLVYTLDRRRWTAGLILAALLLCTKEDQFVILFINGLLFAVTARDRAARRAGLLISALAVVTALLYFGIVRHVLTPHVPYLSLGFFNWQATGGERWDWHAAQARLAYVLILLAPLAFLPCLSRYGLFLIPGFLEILGSNRVVTLMPGAHYSALLTGYVLAAFVDGVFNVATWRPRIAKLLALAAAATSLLVGVFESPMEYWYYLYRLPNNHDTLLQHTLNGFAARSDLGAEDEIFSHLGLDPNASLDFSGQRWFVYDATHYSQHWHDVDEPAVRRAVAEHSYAIISRRDGIVVLRKTR